MKFGFVAKHRGAWPAGLMRETLGVSRSGFYAWLEWPRSLDDERLGRVDRQSFLDSDRTYGSRRVSRDQLSAGERRGLHRIERLMQAQARRRGLPVDRGERPFVAPAGNVLDRQFEAAGPDQKMGGRLHLSSNGQGLALPGGCPGSVFPAPSADQCKPA